MKKQSITDYERLFFNDYVDIFDKGYEKLLYIYTRKVLDYRNKVNRELNSRELTSIILEMGV